MSIIPVRETLIKQSFAALEPLFVKAEDAIHAQMSQAMMDHAKQGVFSCPIAITVPAEIQGATVLLQKRLQEVLKPEYDTDLKIATMHNAIKLAGTISWPPTVDEMTAFEQQLAGSVVDKQEVSPVAHAQKIDFVWHEFPFSRECAIKHLDNANGDPVAAVANLNMHSSVEERDRVHERVAQRWIQFQSYGEVKIAFVQKHAFSSKPKEAILALVRTKGDPVNAVLALQEHMMNVLVRTDYRLYLVQLWKEAQ